MSDVQHGGYRLIARNSEQKNTEHFEIGAESDRGVPEQQSNSRDHTKHFGGE